MSFEAYVTSPLWPVLVETVHAMVMYPHHKGYTREFVLREEPDVTARNLAAKMGIPLGEALVILYELRKEESGESTKATGAKTSEAQESLRPDELSKP